MSALFFATWQIFVVCPAAKGRGFLRVFLTERRKNHETNEYRRSGCYRRRYDARQEDVCHGCTQSRGRDYHRKKRIGRSGQKRAVPFAYFPRCGGFCGFIGDRYPHFDALSGNRWGRLDRGSGAFQVREIFAGEAG